jgi:hypothetical protein
MRSINEDLAVGGLSGPPGKAQTINNPATTNRTPAMDAEISA